MITQEQKDAWVAALKGGEYRHANREFKTADGCHCTLGVLLDLNGHQEALSRYVDGKTSGCWDILYGMLGFELPGQIYPVNDHYESTKGAYPADAIALIEGIAVEV
jgi:hypothetical protein